MISEIGERYLRRGEYLDTMDRMIRARYIYETYNRGRSWYNLSSAAQTEYALEIDKQIDQVGVYRYANSWPCRWLSRIMPS